MATKKSKPASEYQPVWNVGYGSHVIMLASPTADEAIREAHERDPVLRALPTVAEPVVTADGFHAVALVLFEAAPEPPAPEVEPEPAAPADDIV